LSSNEEPVDKYLPELQSFKAVLKLNKWHPIHLATCYQHGNQDSQRPQYFCAWSRPRKDELIKPVKNVLKTNQIATQRIEKLKARLVAYDNMKNEK
jgi:hypothetical protein